MSSAEKSRSEQAETDAAFDSLTSQFLHWVNRKEMNRLDGRTLCGEVGDWSARQTGGGSGQVEICPFCDYFYRRLPR